MTTFRGRYLSRVIVWTTVLWITRGYLWISGTACGQVEQIDHLPSQTHPHIWTIEYGVPEYIRCRQKPPFCGGIVDELRGFCPQANQVVETGISPTSRERRVTSSHMYGFLFSIHSIHKSYYYYYSHILFIYILETKM